MPFVGASIGYLYHNGSADQATDTRIDDSWLAGPEMGVKCFLNGTTFIQFMVSYDWSLNNTFNDGEFLYSLGLGVRL